MKREILLDLLRQNHLTLASCESITGGLFASTFTSIPGASEAFRGSLVTYCDQAKMKAGVSKKTLDEYTAISPECAKEMCLAAYSFYGADVVVSFTGNAGPTAQDDKPVGLVYVGVKICSHLTVYTLNLTGSRDEIRQKASDFAFKTLINKLENQTPKFEIVESKETVEFEEDLNVLDFEETEEQELEDNEQNDE